MKAVQFNYSFLRYIFCKTVGTFLPSLYWNSQLSCLHYRDIPEPVLPNNQWVKIKVKYGGICGSDINLIFLRDSPALSPFTSFPFTLGHELVGVITEVGSEVTHLVPGDRVVIDPILSCETRGIYLPCSACQRGDFSLCEHMTDGHISPGLLVGTCHDTGGSWSPYLVAHQSQVFKLPPEIDDRNGVMVEPFSCALHSVLRNPPKNHDTVLIIGAGVIGLCILAAIRALDISCRIIVLAKHDYQAELASHYGADEVIRLTSQNRYFSKAASSLHAKLLTPIFGSPVAQGGADITFECVGKERSIHDALRLTKSGGKVILLGLAGILNKIDWTTVWLNELTVKGSFAYSTEKFEGKKTRTYDIAIQLIATGKVDLSPLITHRFPLEQYKRAISTAINKGQEAAVKVVFEH
ncbi:zinc-dependent alcohol dehydrogenase [Aneurinibacillus danicus]|uniref:Alcohol dehydrogenase n=1 Tax=Aneurinibacillus danicus TaxID=267746 RepID=A0A511VD27_9BACL|nr:alcohol dehydrogenase catalytic domain-containing protein [Aneurinibacillus danicus]GEN36765.1 alcohol dehydrogenase [Aneurinibacillus danicus]